MPKNSPQKIARRQRDDVKNVNAPRGRHWCYMHNGGEGAYLWKKDFHKNKNKIHGLNDRCKACATEYRLKYEEKYGKRSDTTKTIRVTHQTHGLTRMVAYRKGTTFPDIVRRAVKFYLDWACANADCDNPRNVALGPICTVCFHTARIEEDDVA